MIVADILEGYDRRISQYDKEKVKEAVMAVSNKLNITEGEGRRVLQKFLDGRVRYLRKRRGPEIKEIKDPREVAQLHLSSIAREGRIVVNNSLTHHICRVGKKHRL